MTSEWILVANGSAVIICAILSGVFLAFSDFVMKSLVAAPPAVGTESMQLINREVYGSVFLTLFMGFAAASLMLAYVAWFHIQGNASIWALAGCGIYLVGVFLLTVVFNVPMNKQLDVLDPSAAQTVKYWKIYSTTWTNWNHVRTFASAAAAVCFLVGVISM